MYDVDKGSLASSLQSANSAIFTKDVVENILSLGTPASSNSAVIDKVTAPTTGGQVTVASGTTVAQIVVAETGTTKIDVPANLPVLIFESAKGGVETVINSGNTAPANPNAGVERVVVAGGGNNKITVADAKNTKIVASGGNDSIATGTGSDVIVTGGGNDTVDGGAGFDVAKVKGKVENYDVSVSGGTIVAKDKATGETIQLKNIQYVELDNGEALVGAKNAKQAAVATLYEAALGRVGEGEGIKYWFDLADKGASLTDIARAFANSAEAQARNASLSDDAFVRQLYQETFGRSAETAGLEFWKNKLASGLTRADLTATFGDVAGQNLAGSLQTEAVTTVGYIKVVGDVL